MLNSERIWGATRRVIVTMLAATATLAAEYRQPNFAIPIGDASGRVTGTPDRARTDPMNQVKPIVNEILFLDSHRALSYVAVDINLPTLVMTDYARRQVSVVDFPELKTFYPRQALLAGFRVGRGSGLTAVVLQVMNDESAAGISRTTTMVTVCVFDGEGLVSRSIPIEVEREEYTSSEGMPNPKWYFLTPGSIESGGRKAGVISNGRVFLRDVNGDGYDDVVLWRRNLSSLPDGAPESPSYGVIERFFERKPDDARVMTYDPVSRAFSAATPAERLSPPSEELWDSVPNFRYRTD